MSIEVLVLGLSLSMGGGFNRITLLRDGIQQFHVSNDIWCVARSVHNDGTRYALSLSIERGHVYDLTLYPCDLTPPQYHVIDFTCLADQNHDGGVDISDLTLYLHDYDRGWSNADVTDDGGVGIEDLLYYLEAYQQGCGTGYAQLVVTPLRCQVLKQALYQECFLQALPNQPSDGCYRAADLQVWACILEDRKWLPR